MSATCVWTVETGDLERCSCRLRLTGAAVVIIYRHLRHLPMAVRGLFGNGLRTIWGLFRDDLRTILGLFGDYLGNIWGPFGDDLGTIWGLFGDYLDTIWRKF